MPLHAKKSATMEKLTLAAAQLFARQGYHGTSTREIARLADVSENTIFRHFDRKEDLFWSAVRSRCSAVKLRRDVVEGMTDGDAPEVILPKIIEFLADILNYSPELLRLIAVALLEMQWKADIFCDECLSPAFSAIGKYLAMNVQNGRVRNLDPTMVTAALTTMVLVHPWLSRLIDGGKTSYSDDRDAGRAYTRFWLDVLSPRTPALSATDLADSNRKGSGNCIASLSCLRPTAHSRKKHCQIKLAILEVESRFTGADRQAGTPGAGRLLVLAETEEHARENSGTKLGERNVWKFTAFSIPNDLDRIWRRLLSYFLDVAAFSCSAFHGVRVAFRRLLACAVSSSDVDGHVHLGGVSEGSLHWMPGKLGSLAAHLNLRCRACLMAASLAGSIAGGLVIVLLLGPWGIPRSVYVLDWLMASLLTLSGRLAVRVVVTARMLSRNEGEFTRTLIYGAGSAGLALILELRQNETLKCDVIGLIDDDPRKANLNLAWKARAGSRKESRSTGAEAQDQEGPHCDPFRDGTTDGPHSGACSRSPGGIQDGAEPG